MRNEKNEKGRPGGVAKPGEATAVPQDATPAPGFFLAVHRIVMGASKILRVYSHADGLSFLGLGPPHPWIDLESARKLDSAHWAIKASQAVRKGVAIAIAGASVGAGVLGIILLKAVFQNAPAALDIIVFVLTAVGLFVPLLLLVLTGSIRLFTSRVAYLDSLNEEQIRKEAKVGKWFSFWAAANELSDVSVDPVDKGAKGKAAALLSFKHEPTGKWKLELVARKDVKAGARVLVGLLGEENVTVNVRLKKE